MAHACDSTHRKGEGVPLLGQSCTRVPPEYTALQIHTPDYYIFHELQMGYHYQTVGSYVCMVLDLPSAMNCLCLGESHETSV